MIIIIIIYSQMLVMYPEATRLSCSLKAWFRELGFSIYYGSLLLKTWRIGMVFKITGAKKVKLTDKGLMIRLSALVAVMVLFLIVRMAVGTPDIILGKKKRHCIT